jgi:PAS domain S-box-containing protein
MRDHHPAKNHSVARPRGANAAVRHPREETDLSDGTHDDAQEEAAGEPPAMAAPDLRPHASAEVDPAAQSGGQLSSAQMASGLGPTADPLALRLFVSNPQPMLIYDVETFAIVDVNDALTATYGYSRAELLSMQILDLLPAEDVPELEQVLRTVLRPGRPPYRPARRWRHVYKDGLIHDVDVAAHDIDLDGREAVLIVTSDVTERLHAERERDALVSQLAREADEKAAILEQMADAVVVADAQGRVIVANQAAFAMFDVDGPTWPSPSDDVRRSTIYDAQGEPVSGADRPFMRSTRGETVRGEFRLITRKDRERWIAITSGPLRDDRGAVTGVVWIGRDITEERRRREREAQGEKLRALGQMASGVAHDVNQYLGLVAGYGDLTARALEGEQPDLAAAREALDVVVRAAMDGSDTVKRLLSFARPTLDGSAEPVDIGNLVREVAALTAPRWRGDAQQAGRPISVVVEVIGETVVNGWASSLREALTNLVFNAIDALPHGGSIRLEAVQREQSVVVSVADTGVGIPESAMQHVFEPFFTTKGERGTGLGLAIVYGIVERHAGALTISSPPGQGTTVTITLPSASLTQAPTPAHVQHRAPKGLRILVVDDEPSITRMVAMMLTPYGHDVTTAASGEEALTYLDATDRPFDLIVSDLGLGAGINGWELLDRVREIAPTTRFVLSTGWGAQIDPATVAARGGEGLLPKPYDLLRILAGPA